MGNLGSGELLPVPSLDTEVCNNMFKIIYTVRIFRSGHSDQNAQWICSSPLSEIRIVACMLVITGP
jgi:hypothetical protein